MLARDIMTREVYVARPDDEVDRIARLMLDNKISGVPVVDEKEHVVGIITEKDLIIRARELRVPFYVTLFDSIIFLENPIRFNNEVKKYIATKVKDAMTAKVITVEEDTPVSQVVKLMQEKKINRVPVVRNHKLVGIITRNDILKVLVSKHGN
ncbi:MAG: CBS domain-containing protein [Syntrophomonadaceae bacterium]|jgi:CBS domain-containing protein|nr:CBS domain-containing protein [Syntrophomonadaceae bacterium]